MVDEKKVREAIKVAKEKTEKVKFSQSYDLIVTLKDLDLKKPDQQVDFFENMPFPRGKPVKVCGLVGPELAGESEKNLDYTVKQADFAEFAKKKSTLKKLASEYDFFVAQANVMPQVAQNFGRVLGPRGKMPNPKAGCVVPPKAQLGQLKERLQKTVRITAKTAPHVQLTIGAQDMEDDQVVENVKDVFAKLVAHLPQGDNNIKRAYLKLTMSPTIKVL